jgi:hypothetical protein
MNTAQQVRIWVGVGVGVLLTISCFGMLGSLTSVTNFAGTGNTALFTTNAGGFYAWFILALICLAAEAVLAGFTIYRMYNPLHVADSPQPQASWQGYQAQGSVPNAQAPWQQGTPAQTPWQGTPAQGAPAQGPPAQGPPAQGPPAQGPPAQGPPAQGPPAQGPAPREVVTPEYAAPKE